MIPETDTAAGKVNRSGDRMTGPLDVDAGGFGTNAVKITGGLMLRGETALVLYDLAGTTRRGSLVGLFDRITLHADGVLPILFEAGGAERMRLTGAGVLLMAAGAKITLSADPVAPLDAAPKQYVDSDIQVFTANGTWTKPANCRLVELILIGAGGGGGSGRRDAAGTLRNGGGGGGAGAFTHMVLPAALFDVTETVAVGVGGAGGTAVAVTTNGNVGATGAVSSVSMSGGTVPVAPSPPMTVLAGGGSPGGGGTAAAGGGAGSGGRGDVVGGFGVAASSTGLVGPSIAGVTGYMARMAMGGGAGGGITAANVLSAGGGSAVPGWVGGGYPNPVGGAAPGGLGGAGPNVLPAGVAVVGSGGGGGASGNTAPIGTGGAGGRYGGGGGGGGARDNLFAGGAGGAGGDGIVVIISHP